MQLDEVVPWGRSFDEYMAMFGLDDDDLHNAILDCAAGPASFTAEATQRGAPVVAVDPLYAYPTESILLRIEQTREQVMRQVRQNRQHFVWKTIPDPNVLEKTRVGAMDKFLADYDHGRESGRYVNAELPLLPFRNRQFGIVLCSHFLFLYTDLLDLEFHKHALLDMLRVADQVRLFPLMDLDGRRSRHVQPVCLWLHDEGFDVRISQVKYEFQRGANQMIRIQHPK